MTKHKKENEQEEQNNLAGAQKTTSENSEHEKVEQKIEPNDVKIEELENQVKEWQDKFLRKAAEFENFKRRTENDQFNLLTYAAESFIVKLLPIVDDFERSMAHIEDIDNNKSVKDGIKLVYEKLQKLLADQGVKKMQVKGEAFNVNYHDALMQKKDDSVPPHTVLDEVESGYLYRDKVIRHAKVIVSEDSSTDENQFSNDDSSESTSENEN